MYKHYATLYFVLVFDGSENELAMLDLIQGKVCVERYGCVPVLLIDIVLLIKSLMFKKNMNDLPILLLIGLSSSMLVKKNDFIV